MIIEIHTELSDPDPNDGRIVFNEYAYENLEALIDVLEAIFIWERKKRQANKERIKK